jgi:MFS superfamily sulfate permease-like transporter
MNNTMYPMNNWRSDLPSGIVVFLVALPLCLGVALASGAPLFSGIIAGVVGGIVVASFSGSALSVSGPAAGLTTIVLSSIQTLGSFETFLLALFLAGAIQLALGAINAGGIGNYFPSAVIKGMLSAIGIILILKQIPHMVGYDKDFVGDESFIQRDGENTFTEIIRSLDYVQPGAIIICFVSIGILILWERPLIKRNRYLTLTPAALLVVFVGILLNGIFISTHSSLSISADHLVSLPVAPDAASFISQFSTPTFSSILSKEVWIVAFTIAIIASLETLLSIDAVDKLDPYKRITPLSKELKAQGIGNMISGLIGGLPVTSVIVRSSANVASGAKTKLSSIFHGALLLLTALFIPGLLNKIPLASLAAILLMVGYKLVKPSIVREIYKKGWDQFIPFIVTIIAILLTDLLQGILIGIVIGLIFLMKTNFHQALFSVNENGNYLIRLMKDVSFLNKALIRKVFREIPNGSYVIIDGARSTFIDHDILETIDDFRQSAITRNITVELRQSITSSNPYFKAEA